MGFHSDFHSAGAFSKKYELGRLRMVSLLTKGSFTSNKHLEEHFVRTDTMVSTTGKKLDNSKQDENVTKGRGRTREGQGSCKPVRILTQHIYSTVESLIVP